MTMSTWITNKLVIFLCASFFCSTNAAGIRCLQNEKFYRDPDRPLHKIWTDLECSKYFLCLDGDVFDFRCSEGLLFDVNRQICDFKLNVDNCDITADAAIPPPLLEHAGCQQSKELGCADGSCLPEEYFCDGSVDCLDGSDEGHCDIRNDVFTAASCDKSNCRLPDCFCSEDGKQIPGNLNPLDVPQMILLTFDDAINNDNSELYFKVLFTEEHRNPNGCPIQGTFFVSHQYNNYYQTQKLWNLRHEIAVHSITHRGPEDWWSYNATIEDWFDEMVGQANILHKFSKIPLGDLRGMRVPFFKVGWNKQFLMMKEFGFVYDSSVIPPYSDVPLWPYTLDHKMSHDCTAKQSCPTRSYPGIWEMVINQLVTKRFTCATLHSCSPNLTGDEIYRILTHNFRRHHLTNRAPYGLHFHSSWFKKPEYLTAFQRFINDMLNRPDVWFVTNSQAIEWMRQPTPISDLDSFQPWKCSSNLSQLDLSCTSPNVCNVHSTVFQQSRLLHTCADCPEKYPWIRNEFGSD